MKDLYKQLGVDEAAGDGDVRAALAGVADPQVREAAALILLDPRRREVYDRNRRVVATIGRLRANLGLNLTRFWPRARFSDFTIDLTPPPPPRPRYIDPMAMAWAFGVRLAPSDRQRRARRVLFGIVAFVALATAAWVAWRWQT